MISRLAAMEDQPVPGYTLVHKIGEGGQATVYLAERDFDGLRVALKVLETRLRKDPVFLERFVREYKLVASLSSAYVARIYDQGFSGRWVLDHAFSERGLEPTVVLSAIDADVSKAYVEMGLGIAILATIAFDPARDTGLRSIDARHLFPASILRVAVRRHGYLRPYMFEFLRAFAPHLGRARVERALAGERVAPARNLPEL